MTTRSSSEAGNCRHFITRVESGAPGAGAKVSACAFGSLLAEVLSVVDWFFLHSSFSLGHLEFPREGLLCFRAAQEQMTVALAQATVEWFSLYSFSSTWYSP